MPPPRSPTWEQNYALRLRFERGAKMAYPNMRCTSVGHRASARVRYTVMVPVTEYEPRLIEIHFRRTTAQPALTAVYADGPPDSPHRYAPHPKDHGQRSSLCIWFPDDAPDQRWTASDGLLSLIEMTRVHLFKEAHWRETGEWLGAEVAHGRSLQLERC